MGIEKKKEERKIGRKRNKRRDKGQVRRK